MRYALGLSLLFVAACSKKDPKSEPSADFKNDVTVFCAAISEGPMSNISDLGPRVLSRIRTDEFKRLFDMRQTDPTNALYDRLDVAAKRSGVTSCPTLDWMKAGFR